MIFTTLDLSKVRNKYENIAGIPRSPNQKGWYISSNVEPNYYQNLSHIHL